ncbi:DNA cytosine methyltransferase [Glaciimonas immobilis]|uniref:DNA cytosine methyltransferase n=2 Tax=Glaciimonas immobilis TaxID=728004 RepID=UPI0014393DC5|nr:DNA cytosine methyltransferase [Glaciimonas immobilis]KAF3999075.1 DNA cytosine methyltransferase [Glaciimonas immobilis]
MYVKQQPTIGSLFAGIGGFDLGFEQAGFKTVWQVEINPVCRAVLASRFPDATQYDDVRLCGAHNLPYVDVITGGFPCQDVSAMGKRRGLAGSRTGLFFEVIRILNELRPQWVVLENVTGLLNSNDGEDFQTVVATLAECGYLGYWRVLNAQYFGVPTRRRRVFMVAGRGRHPPFELLADTAPVGTFSGPPRPADYPVEIDGWTHPTLLSGSAPGQINISGSGLIATANRRDQMVNRQRTIDDHGLCAGLDAANFAESHAAGNAVVPQVARWVGECLMRGM